MTNDEIETLKHLRKQAADIEMALIACYEIDDKADFLTTDGAARVKSLVAELSERYVDQRESIRRAIEPLEKLASSEAAAMEAIESAKRRKWLASVKAEAAQTGRSIDDIAKERPWDKQ